VIESQLGGPIKGSFIVEKTEPVAGISDFGFRIDNPCRSNSNEFPVTLFYDKERIVNL
jgi:hypothetical protein